MPISARPARSSRPWIAAVLAVALMLSLAAVMAPAVAGDSTPGTVEFAHPPESLVADEDGTATFVVDVTGDFAIDAAVLSGGVGGIDVTVELTAPDDSSVIASATEPTVPGEDSATASATIQLQATEPGAPDPVAPGFYDVVATAWLVEPEGEALLFLGTDELGPLWYDPNGLICTDDEQPCEVSSGGTSVTLDFEGDAALLSLLGAELGLDPDACEGDYTPLPETVFFDIVADGADTATITVDLTRAARQIEQNNGISQYQFCYLGGQPFDDRDGHAAVEATDADDLLFPQYPKLQYGPALLPECSANGEVAPCVLNRTSRGGGAQFTFLVPTGDPMFR